MEVWASYDSHLDDPDEERDMKLMGAGNERAAEIFVDSGILNPLRKLSNFQSFDFQFDIMTGTSDIYQPQPRRIEMIQDLRHFIECNWLLAQESQRAVHATDADEPKEVKG